MRYTKQRRLWGGTTGAFRVSTRGATSVTPASINAARIAGSPAATMTCSPAQGRRSQHAGQSTRTAERHALSCAQVEDRVTALREQLDDLGKALHRVTVVDATPHRQLEELLITDDEDVEHVDPFVGQPAALCPAQRAHCRPDIAIE